MPDFYSGATEPFGRFTEGFLLRRLQYQRYVARCLQEARTTTDFKFKAFLIEVAQAWQRLADQAKVVAALPNTPSEEPDRGD